MLLSFGGLLQHHNDVGLQSWIGPSPTWLPSVACCGDSCYLRLDGGQPGPNIDWAETGFAQISKEETHNGASRLQWPPIGMCSQQG